MEDEREVRVGRYGRGVGVESYRKVLRTEGSRYLAALRTEGSRTGDPLLRCGELYTLPPRICLVLLSHDARSPSFAICPHQNATPTRH